MKRFFPSITVLAAALVLLAFPAQAALQIQRVVSPGGIEAWLVEDHHVPILALHMSLAGGAALDPNGKEGLAIFTASLLDEGAGNLDSTAFQKELADKSIALNFGADMDSFSGSLKTLTKYRDRAFEMMALSLDKPRFDADAVERVRNEMITQVATSLGNPSYVARRKLTETVFAGHPYARPQTGTVASIRAINAADMRQFLKSRVGRDRLLVTVAGDITPAELGPALDKIFAGLPAKTAPYTIPEATAKAAGETITIQRDIPQTIIVMAEQGLKRNDPDWYTGQILNYTLGAGGFNSRLMEAVRGAGTKRGLSYGVSSAFTPYKYGGLIQASGATKNATAAETYNVIKGVFDKIHKDGITQAELDDAKTFITGSFPLSLTSTDRLAGILMQLRVYDLGIDYLERRDTLINEVTLDDTTKAAARLLDPAKLTTVMIGKPEGFDKTASSPSESPTAK